MREPEPVYRAILKCEPNYSARSGAGSIKYFFMMERVMEGKPVNGTCIVSSACAVGMTAVTASV